MIATRIAESRTYLKKHGRRLAGKVPFGYDTDPETRQLVPNPIEAPQVVAIFERAARGELPKQIADDINDLGWRTKVYHSKRSGKTTGCGGPASFMPAQRQNKHEFLTAPCRLLVHL